MTSSSRQGLSHGISKQHDPYTKRKSEKLSVFNSGMYFSTRQELIQYRDIAYKLWRTRFRNHVFSMVDTSFSAMFKKKQKYIRWKMKHNLPNIKNDLSLQNKYHNTLHEEFYFF